MADWHCQSALSRSQTLHASPRAHLPHVDHDVSADVKIVHRSHGGKFLCHGAAQRIVLLKHGIVRRFQSRERRFVAFKKRSPLLRPSSG